MGALAQPKRTRARVESSSLTDGDGILAATALQSQVSLVAKDYQMRHGKSKSPRYSQKSNVNATNHPPNAKVTLGRGRADESALFYCSHASHSAQEPWYSFWKVSIHPRIPPSLAQELDRLFLAPIACRETHMSAECSSIENNSVKLVVVVVGDLRTRTSGSTIDP